MGADHRMMPAIKQALSMLGQAREALLFAQCPAAVAKVRQAIRSTEGALRTAKRRVQSSQVACSRVHPMGHPLSPGGGPHSMTLQEAKAIARHLGLTLRKVHSGDYRVNFREETRPRPTTRTISKTPSTPRLRWPVSELWKLHRTEPRGAFCLIARDAMGTYPVRYIN
jgi:hypothetical protein